MAEELKIYGLPMSTCTSRVMLAAYEKDAPFHIETVDLFKGAHKQPDFLALQPFGQIPVLKDGELTLFESRAIARYIVNKYQGQGNDTLYGTTPIDRAKVEQWLEVEAQNFNPPISAIVYQVVFYPHLGGATDEAIVSQNLEKLDKVLDVYEAELEKHPYLVGDFFSLADLSHIPYLHYLINIAKRGDVVTSRKNVCAWWERITSRTSWKKVLEAQK